jgi:hypothetical protein
LYHARALRGVSAHPVLPSSREHVRWCGIARIQRAAIRRRCAPRYFARADVRCDMTDP